MKYIYISATVIIGLCLLTVSLFFINPTAVYAINEENLIPLPGDLEPGSQIICADTGLNLRETPMVSDDNILTVLEEYDILIFLGWEGTKWVHVQFGDDIFGYCSARYLLYDPTYSEDSAYDEDSAWDEDATYDEDPSLDEDTTYDEDTAWDEDTTYDEDTAWVEDTTYDEDTAFNEDTSYNEDTALNVDTTACPDSITEQTPAVCPTDYINAWENKSVYEKLAVIPIWLPIIMALGILIIIVYKSIYSHRK